MVNLLVCKTYLRDRRKYLRSVIMQIQMYERRGDDNDTLHHLDDLYVKFRDVTRQIYILRNIFYTVTGEF